MFYVVNSAYVDFTATFSVGANCLQAKNLTDDDLI